MRRTKANMNPPVTAPQITGTDTQSEFSVTLGAFFHGGFLVPGFSWGP
jgi:hypothetical protein